MLDLIPLDDRQLAVQVAVIISKIARVDYPRAWPDLVGALLARLAGASEGLGERRTLLVLHTVLKELASKRLQSDQRAFEALAAQALPPLAARWAADTATLLRELQSGAGTPPNQPPPPPQQPQLTPPIFEGWLLGLKCLRRLLAHGSPSDARTLVCSPPVVDALPALLGALGALGPLQGDAAQRGARKLLKTLRQLQEVHPWSFWPSGLLLPLLEWCVDWLQSAGSAPDTHARLPMLLLHQVLRCPSYRGASATLTLNLAARKQACRGEGSTRGVGQQASMAAEVRAGLEAFWAAGGRRKALLQCLVTRYFPITTEELGEWEASPETFHHDMLNVAWEESVHGCAENLALALFEDHRAELAPQALDLLSRAAASPDALQREAAYRLVSVAADELHEVLDFPNWLSTGLLREADGGAGPAPGAAPDPLRRAALLLPSYWLGRLGPAERVALYGVTLRALGREQDMAIRLSALVSLHALVEDWGFDDAAFMPYVAPCFDALAGMLQDAIELDTQLQVFNLLNVVVDRLAEDAAPFAPGLLTLLPAVWTGSSAPSPLLGMQVLGTLARLLCALGPASPTAYPLLIPALRAVLGPGAADPGLCEDGLQTWLVALRTAPGPGGAPSPLLGALWDEAWGTSMDSSTEHVAVGAGIASSALLLGGSAFLAARGQGLAATLASWLAGVNDRGAVHCCVALALAAQVLAPEEVVPTLGPALRALLARLAGTASGALGAAALAAALGALARVALHAGPARLLSTLPDASTALELLDLWLARFDAIARPGPRKLAALALAALLPTPLPGMLDRLEPAVGHFTAVWFEVEEEAGPGPEHLLLDFLGPGGGAMDDGAVVDSMDAAGEAERRQALWALDPVRSTRLAPFLRARLEEAGAAHGAEHVRAALAAMDPALQEQLQRMLEGA